MSTKAAANKKITASGAKSPTKQQNLTQTTMQHTTSAPAAQERALGAFVDLTLCDSDNENENPVTVKPPMKGQNRSKAASAPQKGDDLHSIPRISNKLTLKELREEALARNIDPGSIPKKKGELLDTLLEGSIHLKETREYKQYMQILATMEGERALLMQKAAAIQVSGKDKRQGTQQKQQEKLDAQPVPNEKTAEELRQKQEAERIAARAAEIETQKKFHDISYPLVHPHKLACTVLLKLNGLPRDRVTCCGCRRQRYRLDKAFSCDACDFDICGDCFKKCNMTPKVTEVRQEKVHKDQENVRKEQEKLHRETGDKELERQRQQIELDSEEEWDAEMLFTAGIMKPSAKNESYTSKGHKFVVWSSEEYNYGSESYQHFDTSWETAEEANARARYLFFWENPPGVEPHELGRHDRGTPEPSFRENLATYTVKLYDSCWTVGVVPIAAFPHLKSPRFNNERDRKGMEDFGLMF